MLFGVFVRLHAKDTPKPHPAMAAYLIQYSVAKCLNCGVLVNGSGFSEIHSNPPTWAPSVSLLRSGSCSSCVEMLVNQRKKILTAQEPAGYVAGLGRGFASSADAFSRFPHILTRLNYSSASGFTTRSDLGPAREPIKEPYEARFFSVSLHFSIRFTFCAHCSARFLSR